MFPSTKRVLTALRAARARDESCTTMQLVKAGGTRFGGRIMELREAGFKIELIKVGVPQRIHPGNVLYRYKLTYDPERDR